MTPNATGSQIDTDDGLARRRIPLALTEPFLLSLYYSSNAAFAAKPAKEYICTNFTMTPTRYAFLSHVPLPPLLTELNYLTLASDVPRPMASAFSLDLQRYINEIQKKKKKREVVKKKKKKGRFWGLEME